MPEGIIFSVRILTISNTTAAPKKLIYIVKMKMEKKKSNKNENKNHFNGHQKVHSKAKENYIVHA